MKLHDIVKEIDRMGRLYRDSESSEAKKTYSQYVEKMFLIWRHEAK